MLAYLAQSLFRLGKGNRGTLAEKSSFHGLAFELIREHSTPIATSNAVVDLARLLILALRNKELGRFRHKEPNWEDDCGGISDIEPVQIPPIFCIFVVDGKESVAATAVYQIEHRAE